VPQTSIDASAGIARAQLPALLITLAFAALAFFRSLDGPDGWLLAAALLALLLAAQLVGASRLTTSIRDQPRSAGVALIALLAIAVAYGFSLSRASSFAAAWVLATIPLVFLIVRARPSAGWWALRGASLLVAASAMVALLRFIADGVRPAWPLVDPNNYATLLYVVFFPWLWLYCRQSWRGGAGRPVDAAALLMTAVFAATVFASQSRAGSAIFFVGLALVLLAAFWWKRPVLRPAMLMVVAVAVYLLVHSTGAQDSVFNTQDMGDSIDIRSALNDAGWRFFLDHPVTGIGINVFPLFYRMARDPVDQVTTGVSPHNDYLQLLCEGGPLLLLPLLLLAAATVWRFGACWLPRGNVLPGPGFGLLMALGAALAHAAINFVIYTPALALLVGLLGGLVEWAAPSDATALAKPGTAAESRPLASPRWRVAVAAALCWGWLGFSVLLLDLHGTKVFGSTTMGLGAQTLRSDADLLLRYARLQQQLNGKRGEPVLAEAMLFERMLASHPDSEFYQQLVLSTYRRALAVDPWNPQAWLSLYRCVVSNPQLSDRLRADEGAGALLDRALTLDPLFLPAYQALIDHFDALGRPDIAFGVVRQRLSPWLQWLNSENPRAAAHYWQYLMQWARRRGDADLQRRLEEVRGRLALSRDAVETAGSA